MANVDKDESGRNSRCSRGLAIVSELDDVCSIADRRSVTRSELGVTVPVRRRYSNRQKSNVTCASAPHANDVGKYVRTKGSGSDLKVTKSANNAECVVRRIVLDLHQKKDFLQERPTLCFSNNSLFRISSKVKITKEDRLDCELPSETFLDENQNEILPAAYESRNQVDNYTSNGSSGTLATSRLCMNVNDAVTGSLMADQSVVSNTSDLQRGDGSSVDPVPNSTTDESQDCSALDITSSSLLSTRYSANFSSSVDPVMSISDTSQVSLPVSEAASNMSLVSESDGSPDVYNTLQSPFNPTFVKMLSEHENNVNREGSQPGSKTVAKTPRVEELSNQYLTDSTSGVMVVNSSSTSGGESYVQSLSNPMTFAEVMLMGVVHEKLARLDRDIKECRAKTSETASEFAQLHKDSIAIADQVSTVKNSVRKTINELDKVAYLDNLIDHLNSVNANMILKPFYIDIGSLETAV